MEALTPQDIDRFTSKDTESIVLFYADWCPFCRKFKPVFESYEKKAKASLAEAKVNEDENPLWDRFGIEVIPTIVAFRSGKVIARADGKAGIGLSEKDLKELIGRAL